MRRSSSPNARVGRVLSVRAPTIMAAKADLTVAAIVVNTQGSAKVCEGGTPSFRMCGCLGICTCPAHSAVSASQALATRRVAQSACRRSLGHGLYHGGRGLYACHRAGYSLVYGPAGPARRERRSDTPARGTPSQACPGTTTDRKLVPPQVHRSVLPKPGTPCRPTHLAGMRAPRGGPADRQQGSGGPGDAEERQ
jgi:hypothetical protein